MKILDEFTTRQQNVYSLLMQDNTYYIKKDLATIYVSKDEKDASEKFCRLKNILLEKRLIK